MPAPPSTGFDGRPQGLTFLSLLLTLQSCARSRASCSVTCSRCGQLEVLTRSRPRRLRLAQTDRLLRVWLSPVWKDWRVALVVVQPETVIAWHRRGVRLFWTSLVKVLRQGEMCPRAR